MLIRATSPSSNVVHHVNSSVGGLPAVLCQEVQLHLGNELEHFSRSRRQPIVAGKTNKAHPRAIFQAASPLLRPGNLCEAIRQRVQDQAEQHGRCWVPHGASFLFA